MKTLILILFLLFHNNTFSNVESLCGFWISIDFYKSVNVNKSIRKSIINLKSYPNINIIKINNDSVFVIMSDFHESEMQGYNNIKISNNDYEFSHIKTKKKLIIKDKNDSFDSKKVIEIDGIKYIKFDNYAGEYSNEKFVDYIINSSQKFFNNILLYGKYTDNEGDTITIDRHNNFISNKRNFKFEYGFEFFFIEYDHIIILDKKISWLSFEIKDNKLILYKLIEKNNEYKRVKKPLYILNKIE